MDGWMDGWMGGCMDGWMGGWVGGWMGGWVGGWVGGWNDGWMDIFKIQQFKLYYKYLKHTLPTFFLNLQFRTSGHNYNTRNQDLYKCRIKHEFARQCLL